MNEARKRATEAGSSKMANSRLSSVTTAVRLLKAFSADDSELGISELAKRLGVAKSTVHRLASTLLAEGLLEQNPDTDRYRLGIALFALGALVRRRMDIAAEAKTYLTELRFATEENVRLAVLDGTQIVFVHDFESPHPVRLRSSTGLSAPAFCTAEGRALLAAQPERLLDNVLAGDLTPRTPKTTTDPRKVRAKIAEVRRAGYAIDDEESEIGMRCIAAPVRSADGHVVAAVGLAAPRARLRKRSFPSIAARVTATADQLSSRLGYIPSRHAALLATSS